MALESSEPSATTTTTTNSAVTTSQMAAANYINNTMNNNNNNTSMSHSFLMMNNYQTMMASPMTSSTIISTSGGATSGGITSASTTLVDVLLHSPQSTQWTRGLISIQNNDAIKLTLTHATAESPSHLASNSANMAISLVDSLPSLPPDTIISQPKRYITINLILKGIIDLDNKIILQYLNTD